MINDSRTIDLEHSIDLILNGFHRIYDALFSIDWKSKEVKLLFCKPDYEPLFHSVETTYENCMLAYLKYRVDPKYHQDIIKFANQENLLERLKGQRLISIEYQVVEEGWKRCAFLPSEFDDEGNITHLLLIITPITDEVTWRESMIKISETEQMTGLLNRQSGVKKIQKILDKHQKGVFMYMDCDKFKKINDCCGHSIGDLILQQFAQILKDIYPQGILIRIGGDEFGVFLKGEYNVPQLNKVVKPLFERCSSLNNLLELKHATLTISVSVGAAQYFGTPGCTVDDLFRIADRRLYMSKKFEGCHLTYLEAQVAAPWYAINKI